MAKKILKKKNKKDNIRLNIEGIKERMEQNEKKWENSENILEEPQNRCCVGCGVDICQNTIDGIFNRNVDEWHRMTPLCANCYYNDEIWEATKYQLKRELTPAEKTEHLNHLKSNIAPMERNLENLRNLQLNSPQQLFEINLIRLKKLNLPIYKLDKEWADKNRNEILKDSEGEMYEDFKTILDYNEVINNLKKNK